MADSPSFDSLTDGVLPHGPEHASNAVAPAVGASRADLERLYRSHFHKLVGFFRRCGQTEASAHDLVQDTFAQALRHLAQFDGRAQLVTWVWAIGRNQLLAHLRSRGLRLPDSGDLATQICPDGLSSPDSGHRMAMRLCVRRGFAAFAQQHPERAEVLYLAAVEGWSRDELAHYLGRTPHAATEYLSQCRAKLKPFIAGCEDNDVG